MNWKNITEHPKTTFIGALLGLITVANTLAANGVTGKAVGTTTVVGLTVAIATGLLGALAKDK